MKSLKSVLLGMGAAVLVATPVLAADWSYEGATGSENEGSLDEKYEL